MRVKGGILNLATRRGYCRVIWLGLLAIASVLPAATTNPKLLWVVDLTKEPVYANRLGVPEFLLTAPTIDFLNDQQIICAFYDSAIDEQRASGDHFHVLELGTAAGVAGHRLDMHAGDSFAAARPTRDSSFVVLADEKLSMYSSDFNLLGQMPAVRGQDDLWRMDVTPDGSKMALYHKLGTAGKPEVLWVDSSTLAASQRVPAPLGYTLTASNRAYIAALSQQPCGDCVAWFLSDDLLLVEQTKWHGARHSYVVESLDGRKILSGDAPGGVADVTKARGATRLAFIHAQSSAHFLSTTYAQVTQGVVVVLDWSARKDIAKITILKHRYWHSSFTQSAIALSPDGHYLAVLVDDQLSLYELGN